MAGVVKVERITIDWMLKTEVIERLNIEIIMLEIESDVDKRKEQQALWESRWNNKQEQEEREADN